jgi:hemerythrin-like domain-containing protein
MGRPVEALDVFLAEHRLIERAVAALERCADGLERGEPVDRRDVARFADFILGYAHATHHAKEEEVLFRVIIEQRLPAMRKALSSLVAEHEACRRHAEVLARIGGSDSAWADIDRRRALHAARGYVRLIRQHIRREDALFESAIADLSPAARSDLNDRCGRFESERRDSRGLAERVATAEELITRYATRET